MAKEKSLRKIVKEYKNTYTAENEEFYLKQVLSAIQAHYKARRLSEVEIYPLLAQVYGCVFTKSDVLKSVEFLNKATHAIFKAQEE